MREVEVRQAFVGLTMRTTSLDAVSFAGGSGYVIEDVPQMTAAVEPVLLSAHHEELRSSL